MCQLLKNLFDALLHHAEILFSIHVFSLGLVWEVLYLFDVTIFLVVTLDAVVDAGGGTRGLAEQRVELEERLIHGLILVYEEVLRGVVEIEVKPAIGIVPRIIEIQRII